VTRYLLDTDILSDLVRNPDGVVAERVKGVGGTRVCTSIVGALACNPKVGARLRQRLA
jgi:tRNA(fMet)-specific endonuclease VapC